MKCRMLASHSCDIGVLQVQPVRRHKVVSIMCGGAGSSMHCARASSLLATPLHPPTSVTSNLLYYKHVTFS